MRSFVKIKPSRIGDITLSFTDIGKSCTVHVFYVANVSLNAIRENKILRKISEFTMYIAGGSVYVVSFLCHLNI